MKIKQHNVENNRFKKSFLIKTKQRIIDSWLEHKIPSENLYNGDIISVTMGEKKELAHNFIFEKRGQFYFEIFHPNIIFVECPDQLPVCEEELCYVTNLKSLKANVELSRSDVRKEYQKRKLISE